MYNNFMMGFSPTWQVEYQGNWIVNFTMFSPPFYFTYVNKHVK